MTTLFSGTAIAPAAPVKKHSLLPVLTVLFLISYGLMTTLIVEQGATIQNQRTLLQQLFSDSVELSAMKGKAAREKSNLDARHQPPAAQSKNTPDPQVQSPSSQSGGVPSSQAKQHGAQSRTGKGQKPEVQIPSRPAADLNNEFRALKTI